MSQYDSIVIGAGHNGLVCAAYLAKSGQSVLLLEASDGSGGLARSREFHPGFKASVAHSAGHFPQKIVRDLKLTSHGFSTSSKPLPTIALNESGKHVVFGSGNVEGVSENDVRAYREFSSRMQRFAGLLQPFWLKTMPRIARGQMADMMTFAHIGLKLRLLGKQDMQEFMRVVSLPMRDLMDENFSSDLLKAGLSWDGLIGSKLAPRSPNNAVLAMLFRMGGKSNVVPAGGMAALISALHSAAEAWGVEVRTGARVKEVMVAAGKSGLAAFGVRLANGETIQADRIISGLDPKQTFLDLVGTQNLEIGFSNRIRRLRCDGYVAKLHLALSGSPEFTGLNNLDGRMIIAPEMDAIEFAYDDAKYGECSDRPVMEITLPGLHDPHCAPAGQHVLSAHVMYAPYRLKGGWNEQAREAFCERAIDTIAAYAPGVRELILHRELLSPADLERTHHVTGGHWHHTEFALDQLLMMRPTYQAAQYSTPVEGLYLCSAGSHPGGDITGAPGHNAAQEILR